MAGNHRRRGLAQEQNLNITSAVLFGLVAAVSWGVTDFFIVVFSRRIGWFRTMVGASISSSIAYILVFFVLRPVIDIRAASWWLFALVTLIAIPNYIAFYWALELGPLALVSPITTAYAAVVVFLSIAILGERLSPTQTAGVSLAIGGVVMASADFRLIRTGDFKIGRGVWLAVAALVGFGFTIFISGILAQRQGWFVPAMMVRLLTAIPLVAFGLVRKKVPWGTLPGPMLLLLGGIGILESVGYTAYMRGAELGLISITASATTLYPLIPIALGVGIFRERLAPNQFLGVGMVVLGVFVLGVSG